MSSNPAELASDADTPALARPDVQGLPLHTRSLTVAVKRLSDSRWHARGDVIDLRKNGFVPTNYDLQPSGVIHMMSIELVFAPDTCLIEQIEVDQPFVAIEPSETTKGECCRDPAPRLLAFEGERLDDEFAKKLGLGFGGPLGCSHLLTLFQLMASTVPRAVALERDRESREGTEHEIGRRFFRRSVFVDGNERSPEQTDVSVQLADTQTRPIDRSARVTERLALSHEVKTFASVDRKRFTLDRLDVRERVRTHESVGSALWIDHAERVRSLVDQRLIPGMAGRVFALMGAEPEMRPVLDNLLMFAPGFIQITAAQMDAYFEHRAGTNEAGGKPDRDAKPAVADLGGNADSCYMWRTGGNIQKAWVADAEGPKGASSA